MRVNKTLVFTVGDAFLHRMNYISEYGDGTIKQVFSSLIDLLNFYQADEVIIAVNSYLPPVYASMYSQFPEMVDQYINKYNELYDKKIFKRGPVFTIEVQNDDAIEKAPDVNKKIMEYMETVKNDPNIDLRWVGIDISSINYNVMKCATNMYDIIMESKFDKPFNVFNSEDFFDGHSINEMLKDYIERIRPINKKSNNYLDIRGRIFDKQQYNLVVEVRKLIEKIYSLLEDPIISATDDRFIRKTINELKRRDIHTINYSFDEYYDFIKSVNVYEKALYRQAYNETDIIIADFERKFLSELYIAREDIKAFEQFFDSVRNKKERTYNDDQWKRIDDLKNWLYQEGFFTKYRPSKIEEIIWSSSIIPIVLLTGAIEEEIIKLDPKGFKKLCTFHNEKTASLQIYKATNSFHCFGCNTGGNIHHYLMKSYNLDFISVIETLAKVFNVELPKRKNLRIEDNLAKQIETVMRSSFYKEIISRMENYDQLSSKDKRLVFKHQSINK